MNSRTFGGDFYRNLDRFNRRVRPLKGAVYLSPSVVPQHPREVLSGAFARALRAFPFKFKTPPSLVFASHETEGGMPHTLENQVIYPVIEKSYSNDDEYPTMFHELCHVHQRQFPEMWGELYRRLGFERIPDETPIVRVLQSPVLGEAGVGVRVKHGYESEWLVANPDVHGSPQTGWWMYNGIVGALTFNRSATHLREHTPAVYLVKPGGSIDENFIERDFGGLVKQLDHPNEISACLISQYMDECIRGETKGNRIFITVHNWIREKRTYGI